MLHISREKRQKETGKKAKKRIASFRRKSRKKQKEFLLPDSDMERTILLIKKSKKYTEKVSEEKQELLTKEPIV